MPVENWNVNKLSQHELRGRPAFKIDIQVVDDRWYLYLAHFWHSGWTILDVTDPTDPSFVRFVEGPDNTFTYNLQAADGLLITSLQQPRPRSRVDGYTFDPSAQYEEGAYIFDIETDPTDPELLGHYKTESTGTHRNFYNGGDYAYMAARTKNFIDRHLVVVDVSDPTDPTEVSRWWWPGQGPEDDEPLTLEKTLHGPAYVRNDRAYLSYGRGGVVILDISDITNPTRLSQVDFGDLGGRIGTHSAIPVPETDLLVATSESTTEGLPNTKEGEPLWYAFLIDISDEQEVGFKNKNAVGPRIISRFPTPIPEERLPYNSYYEKPGEFAPHNHSHYREGQPRFKSSDLVFMTFFNAGLRIFDISDPVLPKEVGYYVPSNPTERVAPTRPTTGLVSQLEDVVVDSRGVIYTTDPQQGLFILETPLTE